MTEADEVAANMRVNLATILTFEDACRACPPADEVGMQVRDNMAEALLERANAFRRACDRIVLQDVRANVSQLVSTLAWGAHGNVKHNGTGNPRTSDARHIMALCDQAAELAAPIADYEEAAIQAGWSDTDDMGLHNWNRTTGDPDDPTLFVQDAREACEADGLEPYEREVYEHWIVSDWLAEKLAAHGEKVDTDFAGLTVWARTTTGQGIASDSVIATIVEEINANA